MCARVRTLQLIITLSPFHTFSVYPPHSAITFLLTSCPPPPSLFSPHFAKSSSSRLRASYHISEPWVCIIYRRSQLLREGKLSLTAQMSAVLHTIVSHAIVSVKCTWVHLCVLTNTDKQSPVLCARLLICAFLIWQHASRPPRTTGRSPLMHVLMSRTGSRGQERKGITAYEPQSVTRGFI